MPIHMGFSSYICMYIKSNPVAIYTDGNNQLRI